MTAPDTSALPLDLGAIERRILAAPSCDCGSPSTQWCADSECGAESCDGHARQTGALGHEHRWTRYPIATEDAVALTTEVRRLRGQLAACVDALGVVVPLDATPAEAIVDEHQRATGEAQALRLARDDAEAEAQRLRAAVAAARREGAEAMREAAAQEAVRNGNEWARGERRCDCGLSFAGLASSEHVTERIRTIPLPEGSDAGLRGAAYRAGAEAMRDALVSALDAMVHAEATEAELFRLTGNDDSAAEHHHKRAVLLEARVTALSLPLPEVSP